jgi:hypothetical protein
MSEHKHPTIAITANEFPAAGISPVGSVVRQFSDEQPALVRLGVRNETASKTMIRTAPPRPFPATLNNADDPHMMYLVPEDEQGLLHNRDDDPIIPDTPDDGCWRRRPTGATGQALIGFYLPAGESHVARYVVLAAPDTYECLPANDYHFTSTMYVDETGNKFDWDLTVTVR